MTENVKRGRPRKDPATSIREQAVRWYATLAHEGRERFRDDLQLVDWAVPPQTQPAQVVADPSHNAALREPGDGNQ